MERKENVQREIDNNYEKFLAALPTLLENRMGKFVLIRNGDFVCFFDTMSDAISAGELKYDDGLFSVQEVKPKVISHLGIFSTH